MQELGDWGRVLRGKYGPTRAGKPKAAAGADSFEGFCHIIPSAIRFVRFTWQFLLSGFGEPRARGTEILGGNWQRQGAQESGHRRRLDREMENGMEKREDFVQSHQVNVGSRRRSTHGTISAQRSPAFVVWRSCVHALEHKKHKDLAVPWLVMHIDNNNRQLDSALDIDAQQHGVLVVIATRTKLLFRAPSCPMRLFLPKRANGLLVRPTMEIISKPKNPSNAFARS